MKKAKGKMTDQRARAFGPCAFFLLPFAFASQPFAFCLLPFAFLTLPACSPYQLRGRVIEGGTPAIVVVAANDARLNGYGLPGAVITATLDPDRPLQHIPLDPQITDAQGHFAIPVDATGAGLLEYTVEVNAKLAGHTPVQRTFNLPGGDKRVLIVLAPGQGADDASTFEPDVLQPGRDNILEETRRMGEELSR